jgi:hypothetical protein
MSGAFFIVLLVAGVAVLVYSQQPRSSFVATLCNLLLTFLPAVLIWVVVDSVQNGASAPSVDNQEKSWRLTLSGFRFRVRDQEAIRVGGSVQHDHLFVPLLPPQFLTLSPRSGGLEVQASPVGERGGGVAVLRNSEGVAYAAASGRSDPVFGGLELERGAKLCRAGSSGACFPTSPVLHWDVREGAAVLFDGSGAPLCKLPERSRSQTRGSSSLRVFSLGVYGRAACRGSTPFRWGPEPADELLYWGPRDERLYLLPSRTSPVLIARAGESRLVGGASALLVPDQSGRAQVDVHLYEFRVDGTLPDASRLDEHLSSLQERRSFTLGYTAQPGAAAGAIELFLHTPQVVSLRTRSRGNDEQPRITISSRAGSSVNPGAGQNIVSFSLIGAPTAAGLVNIIQQPRASGTNVAGCPEPRQALVIQGMSGITCAPLGRWFALGDGDGYQARIRIAQIAAPGAWVVAILALVLVNLIVRDALEVPAEARIVLAFVEILLALRTLVAFEAAAVDWQQEGTVGAAWIALLWLPLAFELVPRSHVGVARAAIARVFKLLVVIVGTCMVVEASGGDISSSQSWLVWLGTDAGKTLLISLGICAVIAAFSRWQGVVVPAWSWLEQLVASRIEALAPRLSSPLWRAFAPFGLLLLVHAALILSGNREQIRGVRIAAFLVPALVLAWARWDAAVKSQQPQGSLLLSMLRMAVPFLPFATFMWAHDNGAYVYFIALAVCLSGEAWPASGREWLLWTAVAGLLVAVLLVAGGMLESPFSALRLPGGTMLVVAVTLLVVLLRVLRVRAPARMWWSLPALAILSVVAALHLGGWVISAAHAQDRAASAGTFEDATRFRHLAGNEVRVLELIAPAVVESIGVRDAHGQRAALSEMRAYAGSVEGSGWLRIVPPVDLVRTHVDDNVTAVHLLAPFGRIGALGVGIFLLSFGASVWLLAARVGGVRARRAELAVAVIVVTSLYMLLANIGTAPFTGRNFYLLAVASGSDLLEGGLLLAVAFCALGMDAKEQAS